MKIKINIQSISDIITNSSSEVFCTITGKDTKSIYEVLSPLFNGDPEYAPFLEYWEEGEYDEDTPEMLQLNVPLDSGIQFYKAGMEALLTKYFGDGNYTIEYEY